MSSESVAQDQIKVFVDRIVRLKSEVKAINADVREVYAEAKANGLDKTILGKVVNYVEKHEASSTELQASEAMFDLYLTAYFGVGTDVATHRHETFDRATGEVVTEPQAPQPVIPASVEAQRSTPVTDVGGSGEAIQPETANEPHITAGPRAPDTGVAVHKAASGGPAEENGASNLTTFVPKPLRPFCQNPGDKCGGIGRKHCGSCERAREQAVAS